MVILNLSSIRVLADLAFIYDYNASCYTELSEAIEDIAKKKKCNNSTNLLNDYWHKCSESTATSRFAKIINNLLQSKQQIPLNFILKN